MNKSISLSTAISLMALTTAQTSYGSLNDIQFDSQIERQAASANQALYEELKASGCSDSQGQPSETCDGATFKTWENVRALVHTANAISLGLADTCDSLDYGDDYGGDYGGEFIDPFNEVPNDEGTQPSATAFCLRTNATALGETLLSTTGEEFLSQNTMTRHFARVELQSLASRLATLRHGATGFQLGNSERLGGGASADKTPAWSPWSGFIDTNYSYGDQSDSPFEPAFDFNSYKVNAGIDYRLNHNWVVGATLGYYRNKLEHDSGTSIADGKIDMNGYSILPFVLYHSDKLYFSFAAGYQSFAFDNQRRVRLSSNNPLVASRAAAIDSDNDGSTLLASTSLGTSFSPTQTFSIEPYLTVNYQDSGIGSFTEKDPQTTGFALSADDRTINSLEIASGVKLQYTLTPAWGVITPYIDLQSYSQRKTDPENLALTFAGVTATSALLLRENSVDADYKVYSVGVYSVLRGASQSGWGGPASGGIQAFFSATLLEDFGSLNETTYNLGLKYEF